MSCGVNFNSSVIFVVSSSLCILEIASSTIFFSILYSSKSNVPEIYAFLNYIKRVTGDKSWVTQYGSEKETGHQGISDAVAV